MRIWEKCSAWAMHRRLRLRIFLIARLDFTEDIKIPGLLHALGNTTIALSRLHHLGCVEGEVKVHKVNPLVTERNLKRPLAQCSCFAPCPIDQDLAS